MGYKSYSYDEYQRAMELLNRGLGLTETCRVLGWPETRKSTLWEWKHGRHKPPTVRWTPKPSRELAYIIGVLHGDGCIHIHGYHHDIELKVKDPEFAEEFSRAMAVILKKKYMKPYWSESNNRWRVTYSSKAFHIWFRERNLESLRPYIEYDKEAVTHFLRGLYDSEGYNYRCRQIRLYNSDLELLHYVQYLLKKYFGIVATGPYLVTRAGRVSIKVNGETIKTNYDNYCIAIYRRRHVEKFLSEMGFSITEKQLGLPRRK